MIAKIYPSDIKPIKQNIMSKVGNLKELYPTAIEVTTTLSEMKQLNVSFYGISQGTGKAKNNILTFISANLEATETACEKFKKEEDAIETKFWDDLSALNVSYEPKAAQTKDNTPMYDKGLLVIPNSATAKEYSEAYSILQKGREAAHEEINSRETSATLIPLNKKFNDAISGVTQINMGGQHITPKYHLLNKHKIIIE